jgi:mono/diheme cytochrome c family protein
MSISLRVLVFRRRLVLALFTTAAFVGVMSGGTQLSAQQPSPDYDPSQVTIPLVPPLASAGRSSYAANCAPCHGDTGNGDGPTAASLPGPPTVFADPVVMWERSPAELFHTTKYGRMEQMMPPWGNRLGDGEIWNTVAFAWSLHTSRQEAAAGEALYNESCAQCHGADGRGDGQEAPGVINDFTDLQVVAFQSQADWLAGWQAAHGEIGADWSLNDQSAVLQYIRSFSLAPPWVSAYRPGPGVIGGAVIQRTPGGPEVAGSPILLEAYAGFDPVAAFTNTVDSAGRFEFRNLAADPSLVYIATVNSDGVSYSSDFINLTPFTTTAETEISVFGVTDDPSGVFINRSHWIVDSQPGALVVGQIYTVGNDGERTYIGRQIEGVDEPVTVALPLPPGATEVALENGELGNRYHRVGDVVYDTLPVLPGAATRQIILRYALPFEGTSAAVEQEFVYPVDELTLLVADLPNLKVNAHEMQFNSIQQLQGRDYQLFSKQGFGPQTVAVSLQGLVEQGGVDPRMLAGAAGAGTTGDPGAVTPPVDPLMGWLIAGAAVVAIFAVVFVAQRRGRISADQNRQELLETRESLLDSIAELDDLHSVGQLRDEDWLAKRSRMKAQLMVATTQLERDSKRS